MYPLDRRKLALHVYNLLSSLRKTAIILQTSHMSISRWLENQTRKPYRRNTVKKSSQIIGTIKSAIQNDPFASIHKLQKIIFETFGFHISRELVRTAILKSGFSRKKARFFSSPSNLQSKIEDFILKRDTYRSQGRLFLSLDETSFGRNGKSLSGYSPTVENTTWSA